LLYTLAYTIAATLAAKTSLRTGKLCRTVYQLLLGGLPSLEVRTEAILGSILFFDTSGNVSLVQDLRGRRMTAE